MKRGDIYLIRHRNTVGSEIAKARPGVIVSNDALNATSPVVEVVYLTTQPKKELPTHATIEATGVTSTAICEQVDSVSVTLVRERIGVCSEEEMGAIDRALMASLGLVGESPEPTKEIPTILSCGLAEAVELFKLANRAIGERDAYKAILDNILEGGTTQE